MPSIKEKMPSLATNQRSVILPFIDNKCNQVKRLTYLSVSNKFSAMACSKPRKQFKKLILLISAGNTLLTRNINNQI